MASFSEIWRVEFSLLIHWPLGASSSWRHLVHHVSSSGRHHLASPHATFDHVSGGASSSWRKLDDVCNLAGASDWWPVFGPIVMLVLVLLLARSLLQRFSCHASTPSTSVTSVTSSTSVYDLDGFYDFLNSLVTRVAASASPLSSALVASLSSVVLEVALFIFSRFPLFERFLLAWLHA